MLPNRSSESWLRDYKLLSTGKGVKLFFVVEGPTDKDLFRSIFPQDKINVDSYPPPRNECSKEHVINVAMAAKEKNISEVYGFVDLDYDDFLKKKIKGNPQILYTIESCIEVEFLRSAAYDSFIKKIVKEIRLKSIDSQKKQILDLIGIECSKIGQMRVGALKLGKDVKFKDISYDNLIDETYQLKEDSLYDLIEKNGWIKPLKKEVFKNECKKVISQDCWKLCQGHDSTWMLYFLCNKILKKKLTDDAKRVMIRYHESTECTLRQCFTKDVFKQTDLFKECFKPILDRAGITI